MIAQTLGVGIDEAFVALRSYSRNNHLRLREVATDVIARRGQPEHFAGIAELV